MNLAPVWLSRSALYSLHAQMSCTVVTISNANILMSARVYTARS